MRRRYLSVRNLTVADKRKQFGFSMGESFREDKLCGVFVQLFVQSVGRVSVRKILEK